MPGGGKLLGIFVTQFIERKGRLPGDFQRPLHGLRITRESAAISAGGAEITLGVGIEQLARGGHRAAVPHGREHVAQRLPRGRVEMHVARGHQRHVCLARQRRELIEPLLIVAAIVQFGQEVATVGEDVAVGGEEG